MKKTIAVTAVILMLAAAVTGCDAMSVPKVSTSPQAASPIASPTASPAATTQAPSASPLTTLPTASYETIKSKYPESEVVSFKDPRVEKTIRATLGKRKGKITAGDMLKITSFKYDPVNDKSATGTIKTLDDLRYCVNLDTLHVLHQPVTSIECLRELDKLKDVCILGCSVSDLSPLAGKNSMREVWISGNPVTDASPVLALPNLIEFNAYYGTNVTDISALPATSSLENFYCDNKLKDFTPLLRLKNLRSVTLAGISDEFFREMIQKYRNMSAIRISNSDIKEESLKLLEGYSLYGLSLEKCGLKDISGLAGLRGVSDLRLGGNQIEDISVLKGFTQISYCLDLRNNKISDFSPLESIKLNSLYVTGNAGYTNASNAVLDMLERAGCKVYR